jgi:hypothetical protein
MNNPKNKLTDFQVNEIRQLHAAGVSGNRLSKTFNVSRRQIHVIVTGKQWEDLPTVERVAELGDTDSQVSTDQLDAVGVEATEQ